MAAVEAENWGKLEPAEALLFAGKVDICADHAGAAAVLEAEKLRAPSIVVGASLLAATGLLEVVEGSMLRLSCSGPQPATPGLDLVHLSRMRVSRNRRRVG